MSAVPALDGADLMAFCAQEFQTFFSHMGEAIKLFKATGHLPDTVFRGAVPSQAAANGDKKAKVKRKPTAFNMFVKDKMEEFKAAGVRLEDDKNGNLMFTLAVAEWIKLDEDQKQAYTRKFKGDPGKVLQRHITASTSDLITIADCSLAPNGMLQAFVYICKLDQPTYTNAVADWDCGVKLVD